MTDKSNKATTTEPTTGKGVLSLAIKVADRASATAIALLQDARGELRASIDSGIELTENVTRAVFRFARKASQRIDDASGELLTAVDRTLSSAFEASRERDASTGRSIGGDRSAAAA